MPQTIDDVVVDEKRWIPVVKRKPSPEEILSGEVRIKSMDEKIAEAKAYKRLRNILEEFCDRTRDDVETGRLPPIALRLLYRRKILKWAAENSEELLEWCWLTIKSNKALKIAIFYFKTDPEKSRKFEKIADTILEALDDFENRWQPPPAVEECWNFGLREGD